MTNAAVFESAARAFLELLDRIREREAETPGQWDLPGLGVWSIRGLAGHTSRAILTVDDYLAAAAPETVGCPDAESYVLELAAEANDDAIAERGTAAGDALGDDPATTLAKALDRTLAALAVQRPDRILSVVGGRAIPLAEYLRTRVFELVVHTLDLSQATGIPHSIPPRAMEEAASLAARVAARGGRGEALLLAVTGRAGLPEAFSVV